MFVSLTKQRSVHILIALALLYILLVSIEIPFLFHTGLNFVSQDSLVRNAGLKSQEELAEKRAPTRPLKSLFHEDSNSPSRSHHPDRHMILSSLKFDAETFDPSRQDGSFELHKSAKVAWELGRELWEDLKSENVENFTNKSDNQSESCPESVSVSRSEFLARGNVVELPCGLTLGSHITVIGKPRAAHPKMGAKISLSREGDVSVMVSQFMMELQGLKIVEGEDPPRILHFNPRLKGDWSGKPVIEQNTCYRMQWARAQRCEGWRSGADEETGKHSLCSSFW